MTYLINMVKTFWQDLGEVLSEGVKVTRENRWWLIGSLLGVLLIASMMLPQDMAWLRLVQSVDNDVIHQVSRQISYWGDFPTGTLLLFGMLFLGGFVFKNEKMRRIAMACLLAAAIAGILTNCFRLTLGRPRPSAEKPDGLYGFKLDGNYHGFPSGHSATAMGTTTAIAVIYPPLGVPVLIAGGSVGWARMMLDRHYPTDVLVGGYLGIASGLMIGLGTRKVMNKM